LGNQALTGVFPKNLNQSITSGPVDLVKCISVDGCGLVQLKQSYDLGEMYGMNYGYRSGLNESMVNHLHEKVSEILSLNILYPGDLILDIGSNDATTLLAYPRDIYTLVGVDPTGVKFSEYYPDSIKLIADYFSSNLINKFFGNQKAKVITSFSMFYDLEDPVEFAKQIGSILHEDGIWFFEQSYLPSMLNTNSFDTICHEHLEFYSLKQIIWIADKAGLKVIDVQFNEVNGGSFSIQAARIDSKHNPKYEKIQSILKEEALMGLDDTKIYQDFSNRINDIRDNLLKFLKSAKDTGQRVVGLGASTKGNVLLQYFNIGPDLLPVIGEVNLDKIGSLTPGSLIPMANEDEVLASNPEYLLVLPWHFKPFFLKHPKFRGKKLVFPLPEFEIIQN
jgi:hypothetical protein